MIIAIAGKKRVGKSTLAKMLKDTLTERTDLHVQQESMAAPIKDMLAGLVHAQQCNRTVFNNTLPSTKSLMDPMFKERKLNMFGYGSPREVLQQLGESFRTVDKDFWIHLLEYRMTRKELGGTLFIIDDIRYENEAEYVLENGGLVIHMERPEESGDSHSSEVGLDNLPPSILTHPRYMRTRSTKEGEERMKYAENLVSGIVSKLGIR